jgi:hypothetical protein
MYYYEVGIAVPYGVVIVMFSGEFVQLKTSKLNLVV